MKWCELEQGDVVHYIVPHDEYSYLLLEEPRHDSTCGDNIVFLKYLTLDNATVIKDSRGRDDHIFTECFSIERGGKKIL